MKLKPVKITVQSRRQVLDEAAKTFSAIGHGKSTEKHEEVSFENLEALRKVLTPKRLELLHAIKEYHPESIYALAKIVDRDIKNVSEDLQLLEGIGFVALEHIHVERETIKPLLESNTFQIEIAI